MKLIDNFLEKKIKPVRSKMKREFNRELKRKTAEVESHEKLINPDPDPQWKTLSLSGIGLPEKSATLLEEYMSWTYANVSAIAEAVGDIDFELYKVKGEDVEEVKKHPILELLHRPNQSMTKREFIYLLQAYRSLTGESPIRIRRQGDQIKELWPLDPLKLTPIIGKTADGFELVISYDYTDQTNGKIKVIHLKPDEVIFIKNMNPKNIWRGYGVVEAAQGSIDTMHYSEQFNLTFFKNSAVPYLVLYTDQKLTDQVISRLKNSWDSNYKGPSNAFKTAILEAGLKVEKLQQSSKDMDFIEQQRFLRDKLMAMFKTTKIALGITEDVNRCFSDDHSVLTKNGWKTVYELTKDDEVATWNQEKDVMEYQQPTGIPKYEYDGELIEYKNNRIDIAVTPNHRMLYQKMNDKSDDGLGKWETKEAQEIEDRAVIVFRTIGKSEDNGNNEQINISKTEYSRTGRRGNEPEDSGYTIDPKKLAEFAGFYVAEGWTAKCLVAIAQNTNSEKYDYIKGLLNGLPFGEWKEGQRKSLSRGVDTGHITSTFSNSNKTLAYWLDEQVNRGCGNKRIPRFVFDGSDEVKRAFIEGLVAGDGHRYLETTFVIRTKSEQLVNGLQRLGVELGLATSVNRSGEVPLVIFSEREKIWVKRQSIKRVQYNGLVWCVTVPNSYIFVRRNGKIVVTGNSNAEASEYVFMKNCIRPKMAQFVESFNEFLLPLFDSEELFLDFVDPVPKDRNAKVAEYTAACDKWMTKNEIRDEEGLAPLEGGDEIWQPLNLTTMSNPTPNTPEVQTEPKPAEQQGEEKPEERPTEEIEQLGYRILRVKKGAKKKLPRSLKEKVLALNNRNIRIKQMREDLKQQIKKILKSKIKPRPAVKPRPPKYKDMRKKEDIDLYVKTLAGNSNVFEKKMNETMKWKYYQPQMEFIMRKLDKGTKFILTQSMKKIEKSVGEEFMFDKGHYITVGIDLLTPLLKDIIKTQGSEAMLTVSPEQAYSLMEAARKFLNQKPTKLAKSITETAYTRIRGSLAEGIKAGESIAKLKDRVIEEYKSLEVYQAETIARTEVSRATNFATIDAFKQSGVVEGKEWLVVGDDRTCEYCLAMESEYNAQIGLDENYFKIGDEVNGINGGKMTIEFDDVDGPPLHCNCRCFLKSVEKMVEKKQTPKTEEILDELERSLDGTK